MITSIYAGFLGLLFFKMSIDTIKARRKYQISTGFGPKGEIANVVSGHANFTAYAPLFLILLYLLEVSGLMPWWGLHALGAPFLLGRVLHSMAFSTPKMNFNRRVLGMHMTLWPLVLASSTLVAISVYQKFILATF